MKEVFSKFTFGFLMAQLLPGALLVLAISSCILPVYFFSDATSVPKVISLLGYFWFRSTISLVVFLFLASAVGMVLHGINWAVVAWVENDNKQPKAQLHVNDTGWHKKLIFCQLLLGPCRMVRELFGLLATRNLDLLILDEKIPRMAPDRVPQLAVLQDFYLNFSQFYMHTAYALLFSSPCLLWLAICCLHGNGSRVAALAFPYYLLTSLLFLIGRIQFGTLCQAEGTLVRLSAWKARKV